MAKFSGLHHGISFARNTVSDSMLRDRKDWTGSLVIDINWGRKPTDILPPYSNKCTFGHVLNQPLLILTNSLEKSNNIYDTKLISLDSY